MLHSLSSRGNSFPCFTNLIRVIWVSKPFWLPYSALPSSDLPPLTSWALC